MIYEGHELMGSKQSFIFGKERFIRGTSTKRLANIEQNDLNDFKRWVHHCFETSVIKTAV